MANSFYGNHWNPIRHGYYPQVQIQPQATKPKIVNIPVHFVGSDGANRKQSPAPAAAAVSAVPTEETRIAAAVRIQRAVRGFLVRKNARVVRQIATEVEEIERKVREEETKIRLDSRERLLVSETLMALLLRLDAVRGVRDFRKRVIRRVVNLQEAIDSISAAAEGPISVIGISEDQKGLDGEGFEDSSRDHENREDQTCNQDEEMHDKESELEVRVPSAVESSKINSHLIETVDGSISASDPADNLDVSSIEVTEEALMDHENAKTIVFEEENNKVETELEMEIPAEVESSVKQSDLISGSHGMTSVCNVAVANEGAVDVAEESSIDHEKKSTQTLNLEEDTNEAEAVSAAEIQAAIESPKRKSNLIGIENGEDESRSPELEEEITKDEEGASTVEVKREEGEGMREMVERMVVENERLKGMVAQLCATSSEQCRLMKGLVDRVEQLERVVHHRTDRRKKRRSAACSAISSAK